MHHHSWSLPQESIRAEGAKNHQCRGRVPYSNNSRSVILRPGGCQSGPAWGSGTVWSAGLRTGSLVKHSCAGSETGVPTPGQTVPPPCLEASASLRFASRLAPARVGTLVCGHVAELADALDLGSSGEILAGSSPVVPTKRGVTRSPPPVPTKIELRLTELPSRLRELDCQHIVLRQYPRRHT